MKLIKKIKKGFTLVELVVVIAIIAILSGVSVAVYVGITDNAKKSAAQSEASSIATVVRAAALMDADGYTIKENSIVYGTVTWDSTKGLVFKAESAAEDLTDAQLLAKMYFSVEGVAIPGKSITEVAYTVAEGTFDKDREIKQYTYTSKEGTSVVFDLLQNKLVD